MARRTKAEESYEIFHDTEAPKYRAVRIPKPPKRAWRLGKLVALVYEPEGKSKKKRIAFEHTFGDGGTMINDPNQPDLLVSEDNQELIIIRGKSRYRIDPERGIMW